MKGAQFLPRLGAIISTFFLGVIYGLLISLAPVTLISHRHLDHFVADQDWQKLCFFALLPLAAGFSATAIFAQLISPKSLTFSSLTTFIRNRSFEITGTIVVFLFTACAALCQKLGIGTLPTLGLLESPWPTQGLILIMVAVAAQFVSPKSGASQGWHWRLTEPISFAWIVLLGGISLLFSTWFPLIALPGIFIGMKWRLALTTDKSTEQSNQSST